LKQMESFDEIGGGDYLMALVNTVPTAANIEYYCAIVKRDSTLRKEQAIAVELQGRTAAPNADPRDVKLWLAETIHGLSDGNSGGLVKISDVLHPHWQWLDARHLTPSMPGYSVGLPTVDNRTGGLGQKIFIVLMGARGSGKTHILVQFAAHCCKAKRTAAVFSMDTPLQPTMLNRLIAHVSQIDSFSLMRPRDEDWDRIRDGFDIVSKWPLYIQGRTDLTITEIEMQCRSLQAQGNDVGLVAIDYAECVLVREKNLSREQELTRIADGCKRIRNDLNTTVMLISQINKDGTERYSQHLGNTCDLLMKWDTGTLSSVKNRLGPGFSVACRMDLTTSRVEEINDAESGLWQNEGPWWES